LLTTQLAEHNAWNNNHDEEFKHPIGNESGTPNDSGTHHQGKKPYKTKNDNYCWSHWYQVGKTHTSVTCDRRADGHKETAMKNNIMAGSTFGVELIWRGGAVNKDRHASKNHFINYLNCTPTHLSKTAILDAGCTGNFLVVNAPWLEKSKALQPLQVTLHNGQVIASTHTATIDLPIHPMVARQAHILPGLAQYYLLSAGQLCDSGCEICFTATTVTVKHKDTDILSGERDTLSRVWHINTTAPPPEVINNVYETHTLPQMTAYRHVAWFSRVKDAGIKAIERGNFSTWPGPTPDNVRK
jgi:hypothetical protein